MRTFLHEDKSFTYGNKLVFEVSLLGMFDLSLPLLCPSKSLNENSPP